MKNLKKMKYVTGALLAGSLIFGQTACVLAQDDQKETENQSEIQETEMTEEETGSLGDSTILVAYFSATNNTEGIAQKLAVGLDADLYEIEPEVPYTEEDLNYGDSSTRATQEQNDPDARPEISGSIENMEQYEIMFLGYPIWWGQAPRIINTFVESYDFDGKTIVPFCTSGSSGFGSSDAALKDAAEGAEWIDGERFSADASDEDIFEWVDSLGLDVEVK